MADPEKAPVSASPSFKGSCACGRITYECLGPPPQTEHTAVCHCVTCRKLSGGPYQAFAHAAPKSLIFYDHQEQLRSEGLPTDNFGGIASIHFSEAARRAFCASCYSPLAMTYRHDPDCVSIALGTVDEESIVDDRVRQSLRPQVHIFTGQKAWWLDITDGLPRHERFGGTFEEDMVAFQEAGTKVES